MAGSVRRQLITSFVLFALALGALFAGVTIAVFLRVEDRLMESRLEQMLSRHPSERELASVEFVGPPEDAPPPFPEWLDDLDPGFYEWQDDGHEAHALLVSDPHTGARAVAIASFPEAEVAETRLSIALVFGVATSSLLALLLARALALRVVSPIERLTERLETESLETVTSDDVPFASLRGDLAGELRDDEVGMLARTLERAGQQLTASAERERRFLREASHELRTPITVIQGVSDLLRESMDAGDTVTRQRLERLDRGLSRMSTSVASLLAMARAEHRLSATDMPPFEQQLEDLIDEARALAGPDVEVTLGLETGPSSRLAASMLIVALSNLVRNAVEHTESGAVHVEVEAKRAVVSDHGPGLPPELLAQLRSTGPQPDAGIGLATVQRICRRFEWTFDVECPAGRGTIATIGLSPESGQET